MRSAYIVILIALFSFLLACQEVEPIQPETDTDLCPMNPRKTSPGVCGCEADDIIDAVTGLYTCLNNSIDLCPTDPNKQHPGVCGCGVADTLDITGLPLCQTQSLDLCPLDNEKLLPGICGCGIADTINIETGIPDCLTNTIDLCPTDPQKTRPEICGCGIPDTLDPETGVPECISSKIDFCPNDPNKTRPEKCGCGVPDVDTDGDTILDCLDGCPEDPLKTAPLVCGCGVEDSLFNLSDTDDDTIPNCLDACPENPYKSTDDGCDCDELFYMLGDKGICAKILSTASDLIHFKTQWNAGYFGENSSEVKVILLESIDLGAELISETATSDWVGIGTADLPFNGIFIGNNKTISATRRGQSLVLGKADSAYMGLFAHTHAARIDSLKSELRFLGSDNVGGLVGFANKTHISNCQSYGNIDGKSFVGGMVGAASGSSLENVMTTGNVTASAGPVGGLLGFASECLVNNAFSKGLVAGIEAKHAAGLVGHATNASKFYNVHSGSAIQGGAHSAGLIGLLEARSSVLNAYTTGHVTCTSPPCAGLIAEINKFSTVKNVYVTGNVIDDTKGKDDEIEDGPKPDNPLPLPNEPPKTASIAALIATVASPDNVCMMLYYWRQSYPKAIGDNQIKTAVPFDYESLVPVNDDKRLLLTLLNENLACTSGICSLDGITLSQWSTAAFKIGSTNMTIPILK